MNSRPVNCLGICLTNAERCSHGAASPCCRGRQSPCASTQRGGYISEIGSKFLRALVLATVLIGIGPSLASAANISGATPTPTPFSHPLLFPPVATEANVSIGIDETCVKILDGPCTNMWTNGGTYPGLTIRRPTGQTTTVTFTNNFV